MYVYAPGPATHTHTPSKQPPQDTASAPLVQRLHLDDVCWISPVYDFVYIYIYIYVHVFNYVSQYCIIIYVCAHKYKYYIYIYSKYIMYLIIHMRICIYIYIKNARHHQKPYLALNKPIYFGWHGRGWHHFRGRNPGESTFGQHFSVFLMVKSFGTEAMVRSPTHQWKPFWYRGTDIFARSKDQNFKD